MTFLKRMFGSRNDRFIKSVQPIIKRINEFAPQFEAMSDDELKGMAVKFKERLANGETLDKLLPEAFATVREGAHRAIGLRPYDVQMIGGIIQHYGKITEMKTGEGKTLVATMPAYLNALTGKGVHVVTVNDYLAKRDAEWMAQVFEFLGLKCSYIISGMNQEERKEAYAADITYATNNELGFDHLRDNMAFEMEQRVQRNLHFAIVDEVDSILIDESRTPLIISGPTEDKKELYRFIDDLLPEFKAGDDYEVDEKTKSASLTEDGTDKAESLLKKRGVLGEMDTLYAVENVMLVHHLNNALRAHACYKKDVDYIVKGDEIVLIDEFTGRMMDGRRLSAGMHQAIEAKEKVRIQNENQTLASITYQNFFRMYDKLAGMTGTADTEAEEFQTIYGLEVLQVPTHKPVARVDDTDTIYRTLEEKDRAVLADIKDCYERGQPILVGTTSIEKSEHYSRLLTKDRVKHQVLNARHHEKEAEIIAQAGRLGAVTIATNMAGRGTDIKMGGSLDLLLEGAEADQIEAITAAYEKEKAEVLELGGLRVLGTERNESRRVDNQLRGRSGRQGDPGSSVFYISLQDDLMRIFGQLDQLMGHLEMPKDEAIKSRLVSSAIETAQRKIESRNFDYRKQTLKYDDVLNDQRKVIYEQRQEVMRASDVEDIILGMREETLEMVFAAHFPMKSMPEQWLISGYKEELNRLFDIHPDVDAWVEEGLGADDIFARTNELMEKAYADKEERFGAKGLRHIERGLLLQVLDHQWKEHLQRLDFLRQGIHLRGFGQKDPLQEFKREAFDMFDGLLAAIRDQVVTLMSRVEIQPASEVENAEPALPETNPYAEQDIGRNDPCPCGSGRKYKYCHGKLQASA